MLLDDFFKQGNKLGFEIKQKRKKHRITYKFKDLSFEIDTFPGLPCFLEIEAQDIETLNEYIKILGFTKGELGLGLKLM